MRGGWLGMMLAGVALPLAAGAQDPPAKPQSVQQLFDTATRAAAAGDAAAALGALDQLETRVAKNARSLAIVQLRKGLMLAAQGERDRARAYLEKGLAGLPGNDPSLAEDRVAAADRLGGYALADLDYPQAVTYYGLALAQAVAPIDRLRAYLGRAQAQTFIDPAPALEDIAQAEGIAASEMKLPKDQIAQIAQVKGRALMNAGRFAEAQAVLAEAVKGQGGLTMKVGYADLVARSDAAVAALLAGNESKAREYLIYTGAGRMPDKAFSFGADMPLPPCGVDGVKPDDRVVVEFGIGDDGAVYYARPVYGSRPGNLAVIFAQAVRKWAWRPDELATIPALFRAVTRLELRCSMDNGGPSILRPAAAALADWLPGDEMATLGGFDLEYGVAGMDRVGLIARFDQISAKDGAGSPALLPIALAVLSGSAASSGDVERFGPLIEAAIARTPPPPLARLMIDVILWRAALRTGRKLTLFDIDEARYAADPDALAAARLARYDGMPSRFKKENATLLDTVIADPALEKDAPLKVAALVRRANLRASSADLAGAQADFAATGLDAAQCSIVDAKPALRSAPTSSADYPTDMVQVGIEGWTRVQFDVGADGRTLNQRAIATYPPMAFSSNGEKITARARYEQTYRPDGGLGCSANSVGITFRN
jgi:tetratricopeptide (TPR) repeat protein